MDFIWLIGYAAIWFFLFWAWKEYNKLQSRLYWLENPIKETKVEDDA